MSSFWRCFDSRMTCDLALRRASLSSTSIHAYDGEVRGCRVSARPEAVLTLANQIQACSAQSKSRRRSRTYLQMLGEPYKGCFGCLRWTTLDEAKLGGSWPDRYIWRRKSTADDWPEYRPH